MIRPLTLGLMLAGPAAAHPHVFVTVAVELRLDDDGRLLGVGVNWSYDAFFSLLVTEELNLDADGDLLLDDAEIATLGAYILEWPVEYVGDVYLFRDDASLPLGPVAEHAVSFTDGVVHESYFRALATPQDTLTAPVDLRFYDPFYYVAYEVDPMITITGRDGCIATLVEADLNAANLLVSDLLSGRSASDVGPDEQFPEVGQAFADTVRVACSG